MLTEAPIGRSRIADSGNRRPPSPWPGAAAAALVLGGRRRLPHHLDRPRRAPPRIHPGLGEILFRHWVLPFEALSVLLLAALVGAIVPLPQEHAGRGSRQLSGEGPGEVPPSRTGTTEPTDGEGPALMHLAYPAVLAALLFCTGLYGVLARRNAISGP